MTRKSLVLIVLCVFFLLLNTSCTPASTEEPQQPPAEIAPEKTQSPQPTDEPAPTDTPVPTPTAIPLSSTVWSEDFDDGNLEEWETGKVNVKIQDGVLQGASMPLAGMWHPSSTASGTWSLDLLLPPTSEMFTFLFGICKEAYEACLAVEISHLTSTRQEITIAWVGYDGDEPAPEGVSFNSSPGWHHLDWARDQDRHSKVYLDGELVFEHTDPMLFVPHWFGMIVTEGIYSISIDNIVERNVVLQFEP